MGEKGLRGHAPSIRQKLKTNQVKKGRDNAGNTNFDIRRHTVVQNACGGLGTGTFR